MEKGSYIYWKSIWFQSVPCYITQQLHFTDPKTEVQENNTKQTKQKHQTKLLAQGHKASKRNQINHQIKSNLDPMFKGFYYIITTVLHLVTRQDANTPSSSSS